MSDASNTDWLETPSADDDSWLNITDANIGKVSLAFQHLIDACMRGTNRVMACDGSYLAYRPFNREHDKEVNPATRERFASFIADGHFRHVGTYDEVQIYELTEGSKFKHKSSYLIGQSYWGDIRQAAKAACDRNWPDYHDILGGMATALKGGNPPRDPAFAKQMWGDALHQVAVLIGKMGGPAEREVNEGFVGVRKARGISRGGTLATLDTSGLQKVEFAGRR